LSRRSTVHSSTIRFTSSNFYDKRREIDNKKTTESIALLFGTNYFFQIGVTEVVVHGDFVGAVVHRFSPKIFYNIVP